MAKGLREIKNRIKAVKNTAQITRAMQLVASSKMKRAQDTAVAGREYRRLIADMLSGTLSLVGEDFSHPLCTPREVVRKRCIVLVSTDKGLCGGLNSNLLRQVGELLPKRGQPGSTVLDLDARVLEEASKLPSSGVAFVTVGRKAAQYVARMGGELLADFHVSDRAHFSEVRVIAGFLLQQYLDGEIDTVEVIYPQFRNTLIQTPTHAHLLPITDIALRAVEMRGKLGAPASGCVDEQCSMLFEPSVSAVLEELPPLFFKEELLQMILEAKASEHSARMVAMKAATDNAKKIAHSLTLDYNKARQAAITQEILEITAAAAGA